MSTFAGNTSTSVTYVAVVACQCSSFVITNKTGGAITVNLWVTVNSTNVYVIPYNLSLAAGEMYEGTVSFELDQDTQLTMLTTGSTDYYFTLKDEKD